MEEAGHIPLGDEKKPQGRHSGFKVFEAPLCKRQARFVSPSPRSKGSRRRGRICRERILALCKREMLTLELIWKWNEPVPGGVQVSGKGFKDLVSR